MSCRYDITASPVDDSGMLACGVGQQAQVNDRASARAQCRSVALPCAVNADKASANYQKGVLTVALPEAAESKK